MSAVKWILLAYYALNVLLIVNAVGRPRQPISGSLAATTIVITGILAWLVVIA